VTITPKIIVTIADIKSSQSSLAVAWSRLPTADFPLLLGSQTLPGLNYKVLTSNNCKSQLTQPTTDEREREREKKKKKETQVMRDTAFGRTTN
jgi:hypothetical protein